METGNVVNWHKQTLNQQAGIFAQVAYGKIIRFTPAMLNLKFRKTEMYESNGRKI
jgi:hypothetical protein